MYIYNVNEMRTQYNTKMKLTASQIAILQGINKNIEYGDINAIAEKSGKSREYVGKVLNPFTPIYNDEIINAAIKHIAEREQGRKQQLQKLPA